MDQLLVHSPYFKQNKVKFLYIIFIVLKITLINSGHATRSLVNNRVLTTYPDYKIAFILFQSPQFSCDKVKSIFWYYRDKYIWAAWKKECEMWSESNKAFATCKSFWCISSPTPYQIRSLKKIVKAMTCNRNWFLYLKKRNSTE